MPLMVQTWPQLIASRVRHGSNIMKLSLEELTIINLALYQHKKNTLSFKADILYGKIKDFLSLEMSKVKVDVITKDAPKTNKIILTQKERIYGKRKGQTLG